MEKIRKFEGADSKNSKKTKTNSDDEPDNGILSVIDYPAWLLERILPFLNLESAVLGLGRASRGMKNRILHDEKNLWVWKEVAVLEQLTIEDPENLSFLYRQIVSADPSGNTTYRIDSEGEMYSSLWDAFCGNGSSLNLYCVDQFGNIQDAVNNAFGCIFEGVCCACEVMLATHRVLKTNETFDYFCTECLDSSTDGAREVLKCDECQQPEAAFLIGEEKQYCGLCMDAWPLKKLCWGVEQDIGYGDWSEWGTFEPIAFSTHPDEVKEVWDNFFDEDQPVPHYILSLWEHNGMGNMHLRFLADFRHRVLRHNLPD